MKTRSFLTFILFLLCIGSISLPAAGRIRALVITGGHDYNKEQFNAMLDSFAPDITYQVMEFPEAYDMFLPENRSKYDVLVFYHMWQKITDAQARTFAECISEGKPLVVLHHSICAFDDWPEYWNIIGGKYFHTRTLFNGRFYEACSYIHDIHFTVRVAGINHPVIHGITDFPIFDETYKGYYVAKDVTPLLFTEEQSSTPIIGWVKKYGKARIAVLQSGHDVPTFENENFRKLLKQSILWVTRRI